ncbi:MAG: hypothetical protein HY847_12090 [Betaproteobacteria bacterium]|nr:hypothetical protein [Betaproteobacteria bacterium]
MSSISSIGSSLSPSLFGVGQSTAGLEAQLARYQIQLADWVSCPSCKTPEGKAKIQELSNKVSDTQQRIKAAISPQSILPAVRAADSTSDGNESQTMLSLDIEGLGDKSSPHLSTVTGTSGVFLNVFA